MARKLEPTDARGWLALGDEHTKRGAPADAVHAYREAAVLYQREGMYLKAIALYKQILVIAPSDSDAAKQLADLHRVLGLTE
ncbi:MAG TPA: hypothetical protein VIV11_01995 [Kofleriaceae bacterium]